MKCIIIDDENMARTIISNMVRKHTSIEVSGMFDNALSGIKFLNQNEIDVVFLDIHMPDFTGFDFIETIKNPPQIILISFDQNFAINAFEYDCIVDYILKPLTEERFLKAVGKIKEDNNVEIPTGNSPQKETINELYVHVDKRLIKINIADIQVIEAKGDYVNIKLADANHLVHSTLKKIVDKLPFDIFFKVHRSFVINTKMIVDIEENTVLIGKDIIPVSRSNRSELKKRLNLL